MLCTCFLATIAYVVNVDFCYEAPISSCVHFCDPVKGADETITGSPLSSCKMGFAMGSWTPSPERTPSPRAAGFGPIVIVVGMLMLTDVNMYTKVYLGLRWGDGQAFEAYGVRRLARRVAVVEAAEDAKTPDEAGEGGFVSSQQVTRRTGVSVFGLRVTRKKFEGSNENV